MFFKVKVERSSGGNHAGVGGGRMFGSPYDSVIKPVLPGEGGGASSNSGTLSASSAAGGGVIRIIARGRLVNNGEISARYD